MRTSIYKRLMEPDIDVEVKNLAIQLTTLTKFNLMEEAVKTFKENKELEKAEAIRLKTETRVSLHAVGVIIYRVWTFLEGKDQEDLGCSSTESLL